jgi:hypothetical protein
MKKIDFWKLMVIKDDYILSFVEFFIRLKMKFDFKANKVIRQSKKQIKSVKTKDEVFVVLNGPSLKDQNLSKLKGCDLMFVNRGFLHPLYSELKPKYHVIIDTKMIYGIWDIKWIDEILKMVPDITFVFPGSWAKLELFKPIIKRNVQIIWIGNNGGLRGLGVSGACFDLAMLLGYKSIFFTGFEATGFAQNLLKQSTHFFGHIDDNELQSAEDYMKGYFMNCRQMRELILYAKKASNKGVKMINLTNGGLLDMFERQNFNDISI